MPRPRGTDSNSFGGRGQGRGGPEKEFTLNQQGAFEEGLQSDTVDFSSVKIDGAAVILRLVFIFNYV